MLLNPQSFRPSITNFNEYYRQMGHYFSHLITSPLLYIMNCQRQQTCACVFERERENSRRKERKRNGGMEILEFVDGGDSYGEGRRAIGGEFLQFKLSKCRKHSEAGRVREIQPDFHHNPGHSSSLFP